MASFGGTPRRRRQTKKTVPVADRGGQQTLPPGPTAAMQPAGSADLSHAVPAAAEQPASSFGLDHDPNRVGVPSETTTTSYNAGLTLTDFNATCDRDKKELTRIRTCKKWDEIFAFFSTHQSCSVLYANYSALSEQGKKEWTPPLFLFQLYLNDVVTCSLSYPDLVSLCLLYHFLSLPRLDLWIYG